MNAIFRQLTAGVHFDNKKNRAEAERFGLVKRKDEEPVKASIELPTLNQVKEEVLARKRKHEDTNNDSDEVINLLGNIKEVSAKKRKKSSKLSEKEQVKNLMEEKVNHFRKVNKIIVQGTDVPTPISEWKQLVDTYGVGERMFNNILYPRPTPIQMQSIPLMLQEREVLACAPTGSGKTAAFVIPLLHSLKAPRNGDYRAVILVPTKELAIQIERECWKFCQGTGLRPHYLGKVKEKETPIKPKHDILISPPNRLVYMINHDPPLVNLDKVEWLVVDEADKLFEAGATGFREQLATIYTACSGPNIKRGMFSATLGQDVKNWCKLNFDNAVSVRVGALQSATETIEQELLYCGNEHGKLVAFRELVRKGITPPVLVFVQSKERAQELFRELLYDGIHVDVIHSDRSQLQRENTVRAFRSGGIWVLICTELMGRGIDFKGVNLVVNYDFPPSAVSYIHRIGRTGRAGRAGKAITYFTEEDKPLLKSIAQVIKNSGCDVPDFIFKLKTSKNARNDMKNKAPKRKPVSLRAKNQIFLETRKKTLIQEAKRKKEAEAAGIPYEPPKKKNPEGSENPPTDRKKKSTKIGKTMKKNKFVNKEFKKNGDSKNKVKKKKMDKE